MQCIQFNSFEDLMNYVDKKIAGCVASNNDGEPVKQSVDNKVSKIDLTKAFYVDEKTITDKKKQKLLVTTFHVIAPFAIDESVKLTLRDKGDVEQLIFSYTNASIDNDKVKISNFDFSKSVEFHYNFTKNKILRKDIQLTKNNGIITIVVPCLIGESKADDFVMGL